MQQAGGIGLEILRQMGVKGDGEPQSLDIRNRTERALEVVAQVSESYPMHIERDGPRLDLSQIQNIIDQHQEFRTRSMNGMGEFDLLGQQVAIGIVAQLSGQEQEAVERGT